MGQCMSSDPDSKENNDINKTIQKDKSKDKYVKKLLFLGSGGSGKSTLFKQLRTLHGTGYADKDRLQFKDHIFAQIVEQMRLCLECIDILKEDEPDEYKDVELSDSGKQAADILQSAPTLQVNAQISEAIEILWKEDAIRLIYDLRATMKIDDSCAYFWDEVQRIAAPDYVPDDKDILLVRYRTTGVIEQKFEIKKNLFHVFDVGGQKSERKKWIHCFESVTAVIFVASLSCYDEVMFEDEEKNSMVDSIELFKQICNNEWFKDTAMILFLNKKDLFAEKLNSGDKPITLCPYFEQYSGPETGFDETTSYIKEAFTSKNKHQEDKSIFTHLTCATDQNNVEKVFNDVQHIIIENSLMSAGLMGDFGGDDNGNSANSGTALM
mmetsp:Transcript_12753/g.11355  ORF Transcript_12753/g.11355 Transcript_12753/m.11355 type:complete len:381 (+) Transcript_12753:96-1238(+)